MLPDTMRAEISISVKPQEEKGASEQPKEEPKKAEEKEAPAEEKAE